MDSARCTCRSHSWREGGTVPLSLSAASLLSGERRYRRLFLPRCERASKGISELITAPLNAHEGERRCRMQRGSSDQVPLSQYAHFRRLAMQAGSEPSSPPLTCASFSSDCVSRHLPSNELGLNKNWRCCTTSFQESMEPDVPLSHSVSNFINNEVYTDFAKVWVDTFRVMPLLGLPRKH